VHLIGHHETGCAIEHYEDQLNAALDLYARLGVDAVKTGYRYAACRPSARRAGG